MCPPAKSSKLPTKLSTLRKASGRSQATVQAQMPPELAPPRPVLGGGMAPSAERTHGASGCRLTLESTAGTLSLVTVAPGPGLVEAVCRFVLGALGDGPRS